MTDKTNWTWTPSEGFCECVFEDDTHPPHEDPADCPNWIYEECANIPQAHTIDMGDFMGLDDATASRIVACWNACAGIPTEQLGDVKALVEGLEGMLHFFMGYSEMEAWKKADAALAPFRKD